MHGDKRVRWLGMALVVLLIATRWYGIGYFPPALTHDEVVYAIQAQSLAIQGTSLNGLHRWWELQPAHPMYAELPAVLMSPFFRVIPNPIMATRILFAIIGVLLPFILGWFSYGVWRHKTLAKIVFGLGVVNPLLWQLSRFAYDVVLSTFFYLFAGAVLLNKKGKWAYIATFLLLLGFFQYQGYKLLFVPWILFMGILVYSRHTFSRSWRHNYYALLAALAVLPIYGLILLPNQKLDDRWSQTIFAQTNYLTSQVNNQRRMGLDFFASRLFENKLTAAGHYLMERFIDVFSPQTLFWDGEPAQSSFAVWGHGWFYLIDAVMILAGVGYGLFGRWERKQTGWFLVFMVIFTLPALVNFGESWNLLRTLLVNMCLLVLAAWGIMAIKRYFRAKWWLLLVYGIHVGYFGYYYWIRYPVLGANNSYLAEKTIANYISRIRAKDASVPIRVYTIDPPVLFWSYLTYTHTLTTQNAAEISLAEQTQAYTIDTITFTNDCADIADTSTVVVTEMWRVPCERTQSIRASLGDDVYETLLARQRAMAITIPSIVDNGAYFRIYNDPLCVREDLSNYVHFDHLNQLHMEGIEDAAFCQRWLTNVPLEL